MGDTSAADPEAAAVGRRASPDLVVEMAPEWRSEREYALSLLLGEWLGLTHTVRVVDGLGETRLRLAAAPDQAVIVLPDVLLARSTNWLAASSLPSFPLPVVAPPEWCDTPDRLPLIYPAGDVASGIVAREGSRFTLRLDLLGSLVFLVGRYEEYVDPGLVDEHGRFPASASILARSGWLQWPVADMYTKIFEGLLRLAWPRLEVHPPVHERLIIGHDVDHPASSMRWRGQQRLRVLAGDMFRRRDPQLAVRRASAFVTGAGRVSRFDPFNTFDVLMRTSEVAGLRGTFFFLARDTEVPDGSPYRLADPWAGRLMSEIASRGHGIALHGSYHSYRDAGRLRAEWEVLAAACGKLPPGALRPTIRQHYLRWQPGQTWRAQAEAGLTTDETLGFAGDVGYRAGTARSFEAFDLANHARLGIRVRPLHVMDATLIHYMTVGADEAVATVQAMGHRTRVYGGAFSLLWHNSSLETRSVRDFYRRIVAELTA